MAHKHKPEPAGDPAIRVRPTAAEKALFQRAAEGAQPRKMSLNAWAIVAMLEKAERDGAGKPEAFKPGR